MPPGGCGGPVFKVPPTVGRNGDVELRVVYAQLQYSQTVLLDFFGLSWPHVTVGSLRENTVLELALPPDTTASPPPRSTGWWWWPRFLSR